MPSARFIAAQIVRDVVFNHKNFEDTLYRYINRYQIHSSKQYALIKAYCFGTLRWFIQIEGITHLLLHKPLNKKHHDILCLICVALYELMHMRTPPHAILHDAVNATLDLHKTWAKGLVNKTLQQFIERRDFIMKKITGNREILYAHPEWLLAILQRAWPNQWRDIIHANNHQAPLFLRINHLQTTVPAYQALLHSHDIQSEPIEGQLSAVKLVTACSVDKLPGFHGGLCSVQDLAGQYIPKLLKLQPGQLILDACAAPGSKTCHLLEYEPQLRKIIAIDSQKSRLQKIQDNILRLKLPRDKFDLLPVDASQPEHWWNKQLFDRILLDPPCSATGVIRRHPDIKFLKQSTDIAKYSQQQMLLLTQLWPLLKPEGFLLYTTCSVLPQENSDIIRDFINHCPSAAIETIHVPEGIILNYGTQLLPKIQAHDGFYYALLKKVIR